MRLLLDHFRLKVLNTPGASKYHSPYKLILQYLNNLPQPNFPKRQPVGNRPSNKNIISPSRKRLKNIIARPHPPININLKLPPHLRPNSLQHFNRRWYRIKLSAPVITYPNGVTTGLCQPSILVVQDAFYDYF